MVYTNSIGAVDCRRYVNIDHRTACAGKLHAPAMQRLTICWFAKEADSAEVVRQRFAGNCIRNTHAKRQTYRGSLSPENALRRRGRIAADAAAADLFCTPENKPDGHLKVVVRCFFGVCVAGWRRVLQAPVSGRRRRAALHSGSLTL